MFKNPIITVIVVVMDNDTVKTMTEANIGSTIEKTVESISSNKKIDRGFSWSTIIWAGIAVVTWAGVAAVKLWGSSV